MRKILTEREKEKKEIRNKLVIGLILVVIMVLSTAGYAFFSNPEEKRSKTEYNGIEFILNENNLWQFKIQNIEFLTQYKPQETENISVPIFMIANNYAGAPLFFVGEGAAKQEIARNLGNFVLRMQDTCLENYGNCKENLPIKNCSDNVIVIEEAEDIKISQDDNCVFVSAPYSEQIRASDAFIFKILGIRSF